MEQFVPLYTLIREVHLTDQPDTIRWKWTNDGQYTAKSAYRAQFHGALNMRNGVTLWQANAEPKCKFLAWLAMHGKAPTADNLEKKNWPHAPHCPLCYCQQETNDHLFSACNFSEATWRTVVSDLQLPPECQAYHPHGTKSWVEFITKGKNKKDKKKILGALFTFWWQIWLERNSRIFDNRETSYRQVASKVLDQFNFCRAAQSDQHTNS